MGGLAFGVQRASISPWELVCESVSSPLGNWSLTRMQGVGIPVSACQGPERLEQGFDQMHTEANPLDWIRLVEVIGE